MLIVTPLLPGVVLVTAYWWELWKLSQYKSGRAKKAGDSESLDIEMNSRIKEEASLSPASNLGMVEAETVFNVLGVQP